MRILALVVLIVVSSTPCHAQPRPRARLADSNVVADNVFQSLFGGIRLSEEQKQRARAIILETWRRQFEPKEGSLTERVRRSNALNMRRDSLLKELIPSQSDRRLFEERAALLRSGGRTPNRDD